MHNPGPLPHGPGGHEKQFKSRTIEQALGKGLLAVELVLLHGLVVGPGVVALAEVADHDAVEDVREEGVRDLEDLVFNSALAVVRAGGLADPGEGAGLTPAPGRKLDALVAMVGPFAQHPYLHAWHEAM